MSRNTNEEFLSVLSQYDGSVDDRRKKYLQDTYGFSSNSALPSMEYQVLGDLGYTGTIDDRWSKYLKALGGTGLSSKAELLSSTFYGFYSANSLSPEFVLDFERETYLTDSTSSAFSEALTFTATGNRTMVDSDGVLKWAPHNLLTYSEDFTNADWLKSGATVTNVSDTLPSGISGSVARIEDSGTGTVYQSKFVSAGETYTIKLWAKRNSATDQTFRLFMSSNPVSDDLIATSEWQVFSFDIEVSEGGTRNVGITDDSGGGSYDILIWGAHFYRSDLGGMVNNPTQPEGFETYVPTTDSAVFLPRRGHHVYDGSAWVNKGLLLESESRTNLVTYSEDFNNTGWTVSGPTLSENTSETLAPDGTNSATKLIASTSSTSQDIFATVNASGETVYTRSFYVKSAGYDWCRIQQFDGSSNSGVWFNVLDGTIGTNQTPYSATIQDVGNGWYRCSVTNITAVGATSERAQITVVGDNNATVLAGDGTSGIYIWGAQLEQASTPSSYIPTSGSTVTRAGETLTAPSDNLPWPEPEVIGEELVTNGTFDTDSDWTLDAASSISGGVLSTAKTTSGEIASQVISITAGKVYKIEYTVISTNGEPLVPRLSGNFASSAPATSTVGTFTAIVTAVSDVDKFAFNVAGGGLTATIDNVSVREINPLAVSIAMEGGMTYADTNSAPEVIFLTWGGISDQIRQEINSNGPNLGRSVFRTYSNANSYFVVGDEADYSPGINVPFSIASRHGSTFINGAVDGAALTADTTPTALPDLSSTDLEIGSDFMGTIKSIRIWADDIGDSGIEEASS